MFLFSAASQVEEARHGRLAEPRQRAILTILSLDVRDYALVLPTIVGVDITGN